MEEVRWAVNKLKRGKATGPKEIPMDFFPDEAEEIARELMAAASACRKGG